MRRINVFVASGEERSNSADDFPQHIRGAYTVTAACDATVDTDPRPFWKIEPNDGAETAKIDVQKSDDPRDSPKAPEFEERFQATLDEQN